MNKSSILVALVAGISLIVSTSILASAIKAYGRSLEKAAVYQQPRSAHIPSNFTLSLKGGNSPLRFEVASQK